MSREPQNKAWNAWLLRLQASQVSRCCLPYDFFNLWERPGMDYHGPVWAIARVRSSVFRSFSSCAWYSVQVVNQLCDKKKTPFPLFLRGSRAMHKKHGARLRCSTDGEERCCPSLARWLLPGLFWQRRRLTAPIFVAQVSLCLDQILGPESHSRSLAYAVPSSQALLVSRWPLASGAWDIQHPRSHTRRHAYNRPRDWICGTLARMYRKFGMLFGTQQWHSCFSWSRQAFRKCVRNPPMPWYLTSAASLECAKY